MLCLGAGFTALTALSAPAMAQEETQDESRTLQTVTITATKREQTLQDVPIAVSVVDDTTIKRAVIVDLNDLQSIIPSLSVGQLQSSANTNFVIRGFGNGANNAGIEPSVGVFIDGVYRSRSGSQISDLPNIERVEVLRGPQSTLFGKNASAGVISVVTKKPQYEFGGVVDATVSNFNGYRLNGYVTGPLAENLAGAIGATYNKRDGYVEDLGFGPDQNERNRYGIRGDLLFEPNENMSFRLMADYDTIDEVCCAAGNVVNGPTGAIVQALGGNLVAEDPFSYDVYYNYGSTNKIDNSGVSFQADIDLGEVQLTSITAYRKSELDTNQDSDFTSADLIGRNSNLTNIETFTQEFRASSTGNGPVDWMLGAFFFDETVEIENDFRYGADFRGYANVLSAGALNTVEFILGGAPAVGNLFAQDGQGLAEEFGQDNTATSLFGTIDYHVNDRATVTLGINYTDDEKDAYGRITNTDAFSALDLVALGVAAGVPQSVANNPTFNPFLALRPLQFLPPFLAFPNAVEDGHTHDNDLTYTARLAFDLTDNVNTYVSYATGFKATSWNLSRDSRPFPADFIPGSPAGLPAPASSPIRTAGLALPNLTTGTRFAGPEEAAVLEAGIKAQFDRVAINLALFDQTISGFQSNVFTGTGFALANAGKQSNSGVELDLTWTPIDPLLLSFAGTFQDPLYDSFPNSASGDISGQVPSGIPETTTSTAATYFFGLRGMDAFVRADWQYESPVAYFDSPTNQALIGIERETSLINASAGFETENGLAVTLWARNIADEQYVTVAFPSVAQAGSISGYPSQPRTFGVTVRKRF
ncbi:MAG: TonB-dependent receptor [Hyphomonas sp.]|nr:TonB-dependent receptor [Hyphomonas sp.]MBU4063571.1 TonB-dependent receptor [Alphaproteobacteria bacterium]MBU4165042.1 TonB-dependent receptor [Alphaproteobacteria bacterium]